jgi:hypothetical protein
MNPDGIGKNLIEDLRRRKLSEKDRLKTIDGVLGSWKKTLRLCIILGVIGIIAAIVFVSWDCGKVKTHSEIPKMLDKKQEPSK